MNKYNKYNKCGWFSIIIGISLLVISIKSILTNHSLEAIFEAILGYINLKIAEWNKIKE